MWPWTFSRKCQYSRRCRDVERRVLRRRPQRQGHRLVIAGRVYQTIATISHPVNDVAVSISELIWAIYDKLISTKSAACSENRPLEHAPEYRLSTLLSTGGPRRTLGENGPVPLTRLLQPRTPPLLGSQACYSLTMPVTLVPI